MSILEKAKELADAIAASEELKSLRDAETAMYNDQDAQKIVAKYQDAQKKAHEYAHQGGEPPEALRLELDQLEQDLEDNSVIHTYLDAQHRFEQIMHSLNFLISKAINGEGSMEHKHGGHGGGCCGGGCGH